MSLRRILFCFTIFLCSEAGWAKTLNLRLRGPNFTEGQVEIAKDGQFSKVIRSFQLTTKELYPIDWPKTGVYYLRVVNKGKILWQEELFALLEDPAEEKALRLSWQGSRDAKAFRIWLHRTGRRLIGAESQNPFLVLYGNGSPWIVRFRELSAKNQSLPISTLRSESFEVSKQTEQNPQSTADFRIDPYASDDDQLAYEPDSTMHAAEEGLDKDSPEFEVQAPTVQRSHHVEIWLRLIYEQFVVEKLDRFEADPSKGLGLGAYGQYFLQPHLSLSASLESHANQTSYELGGSEPPAEKQKRIRAHLALDVDLLNSLNYQPNWSLTLGPVVNLLQIPLHQDQYLTYDFGIKSSLNAWQYGLRLDALLLKSGSRETSLSYKIPWEKWSIYPYLGFFYYNSHQSSDTASARFREYGLRFGLSQSF